MTWKDAIGRTDGIDGVTDGMAGGETKSAAMADLCVEHDGTGAVVECDGGCCVSMPTPLRHFQNEPPNTFVTYFPYIWLPTYLVQVAWMSHLLIFRAKAQK